MQNYLYAISDIHGMADLFKKLLTDYDPKLHQLLLIGDLNDRGPKSKECFFLGKKLVEEYQAIYLRGNHEEYFLQFLNAPEDWFAAYVRNGGKETIESLLHTGATEEYSPTEIALMIRSSYRDLIEFLMERPLYYEWGKYLFVHAGVDLSKKIGVRPQTMILSGFASRFIKEKTVQEKRSFLAIPSRPCCMEICRRRIYGNKTTKSASMAGQYLVDRCMA